MLLTKNKNCKPYITELTVNTGFQSSLFFIKTLSSNSR